MAKKPKPRRVTPPLAVLSFSKTGSVRKYVEPMPEDQEGLEEVILAKFLSALEERHGRRLKLIRNLSRDCDDPPDFLATEGGKSLGIEMTEVVDSSHRELHSARLAYRRLVQDELQKRSLRLPGIVIRVADASGEPPYPRTTSRKGRELVECVVDHVERQYSSLCGLGLGGEQHSRLSNAVCSWIFIRRVSEGRAESEIAQVEFEGGYMLHQTDTLITSVKSKIDKAYSLPSGCSLWLLAYGLLGVQEPEAIEAARQELSVISHPFTEVWYAFPLPHPKGIILHRVWPAEDDRRGS